MGLRYMNLDGETRRLMVEEFEFDLETTGIYLSSYLRNDAHDEWADLLREALLNGTDDSLAAEVNARSLLKTHTQRSKPKGGFTTVAVPYTAPQTLSEGQFNVYYMRALSRRVLNGDANFLRVYRAKAVDNPRPSSEILNGAQIDPRLVLDELRRTKGVDPRTDIPLPNSGMTVMLG